MFTHLQLVLLICALMFYISAGLLLPHRNQKLVGLFLFLSAGCVFSFAALLDPFLNLWDERFHALVAKNMINNPLKPMLYADPILAQDYSPWYAAQQSHF